MLADRELTQAHHASAVLNWELDADGSFAHEFRTTKIKDTAEGIARSRRATGHQGDDHSRYLTHVEFGNWTAAADLLKTKNVIHDHPAHKGNKPLPLHHWQDDQSGNEVSTPQHSLAASMLELANHTPSARETSYLRMLRNALEFCEQIPTSRPHSSSLSIQRTFVETLGHIFSHTPLPSTRTDTNQKTFYFDWSIEGVNTLSLAVLGTGEVIVGSDTHQNINSLNLRSDQLGRLSRELDKAGISHARDAIISTHHHWVEKFKARTITQRDLVGVLEQVNELLNQGKFSELSEAILATGDTFNTSSAVAILRLSFPARNKLEFWHQLRSRLESKIVAQGRDPSKVFRGL